MKTKPHGKERIREFIDGEFVCIGWPGIGDLTHTSKDEIRNRLKTVYNISGHKLGNSLGQVNTFVNAIKEGDIVFVTEKDWAYIGIAGDYHYNPHFDNNEEGMCHRRNIEWINRILISGLESSIQRLLSNRNTICQYPETIEDSGLEKYLSNQSPIVKENSTKLDDLIQQALAVLEEELKSEDLDRRLKAATEIIRLKNNS